MKNHALSLILLSALIGCGDGFAPCATLRHGAVASYNSLDGLQECKIIDGTTGGPSILCSVWSGSEDEMVVPERSTFCGASDDIFPLKSISVRTLSAGGRSDPSRMYELIGTRPDTHFNTGSDEFVYEVITYVERYDGKGFVFHSTDTTMLTFPPGTAVMSLDVDVPEPSRTDERVVRFEINQLAPPDVDTTIGPITTTAWER